MRRKVEGRVHSMAAAKVAIVAKLGPSNHGAKNDEVTPHIARRTRLSPPVLPAHFHTAVPPPQSGGRRGNNLSTAAKEEKEEGQENRRNERK